MKTIKGGITMTKEILNLLQSRNRDDVLQGIEKFAEYRQQKSYRKPFKSKEESAAESLIEGFLAREWSLHNLTPYCAEDGRAYTLELPNGTLHYNFGCWSVAWESVSGDFHSTNGDTPIGGVTLFGGDNYNNWHYVTYVKGEEHATR